MGVQIKDNSSKTYIGRNLLFLKQEQWKKGKNSKGTFKSYWYNNPSNFDIKPKVNHFLLDNLNPIETIDYQLAFNQDNFNIFQMSIKPELENNLSKRQRSGPLVIARKKKPSKSEEI